MKNYKQPQVLICKLQTTVILAESGNGIKNNAGLIIKSSDPVNAWNGR